MKTTIKKRLLRLGILCAGIMGIVIGIVSAIGIAVVENGFSDRIGSFIVSSTASVLQEEFTFLTDGISTAVSGEESDIFENVFMLGDSRGYDYSEFSSECASLGSGEVSLAYSSSGSVYLFAMKRSDGVIVGELENQYFDAAMSGLIDYSSDYGYLVGRNGAAVLSTKPAELGKALSSDSILTENIKALASGSYAGTGSSLTGKLVYSSPLEENSDFGVVYCTDYSNAH